MGPVRVVVVAAACALTCAGSAGVRAGRARASGCPARSDAPRLLQYGPAARGDVDGDGSSDRVWISAAPGAPSSCGIFLVARTASGVTAVRVAGHVSGPARTSLHDGLPRLFGLLRLGSDLALEPVVIVDRRGQAVTFALFRAGPSGIVRMRVPARPSNVLRWADAATRLGSVDCAGVGLVRDSFAERRTDGRWDVVRHTYRVAGAALQPERAFAGVQSRRPPPPRALPFTSCEGIRAG